MASVHFPRAAAKDSRITTEPQPINGKTIGHYRILERVGGGGVGRGSEPTSQQIQDFAWSPDAKRLAVVRSQSTSDVILLRETRP